MKLRVSIRQIEGFLLASETLSFSRASEELCVTQSGFSQLIREMETQLGIQLFDRTTRRVALTPAGEVMQLHLRRGFDAIETACREAEAIGRLNREHVRVATIFSLAIGIVTRTIGRLRHDFPNVTVSMREDFDDLLVAMVTSGESELSICSEMTTAPGLRFEHLFDDELLVITKAGSRLSGQQHVHWSELAKEPLVLTACGAHTRERVTAELALYGIRKSIDAYEVASMLTAMSMVRAGFGSAFVSRIALAELDTQGLATVPIAEPTIRRMGIYRRADRKASPASLKFVAALKAEALQTSQKILTSRRASR